MRRKVSVDVAKESVNVEALCGVRLAALMFLHTTAAQHAKCTQTVSEFHLNLLQTGLGFIFVRKSNLDDCIGDVFKGFLPKWCKYRSIVRCTKLSKLIICDVISEICPVFWNIKYLSLLTFLLFETVSPFISLDESDHLHLLSLSLCK